MSNDKTIMMSHPKLDGEVHEVTPEQFEIWKESGWRKATQKEIAGKEIVEDSQKLEDEG